MTLTYEQWLADTTTATFIANVDAYTIKPGDLIAHNGYVICVEAIRANDPQSPLSYRTVYGHWTEAPEGHCDIWIAGAHGGTIGVFRNGYPEHMRKQIGLELCARDDGTRAAGASVAAKRKGH